MRCYAQQFLNLRIDLVMHNANLLRSCVTYSFLLRSFWRFVIVSTMLAEAWHLTFDQLHSLRYMSVGHHCRLQYSPTFVT